MPKVQVNAGHGLSINGPEGRKLLDRALKRAWRDPGPEMETGSVNPLSDITGRSVSSIGSSGRGRYPHRAHRHSSKGGRTLGAAFAGKLGAGNPSRPSPTVWVFPRIPAVVFNRILAAFVKEDLRAHDRPLSIPLSSIIHRQKRSSAGIDEAGDMFTTVYRALELETGFSTRRQRRRRPPRASAFLEKNAPAAGWQDPRLFGVRVTTTTLMGHAAPGGCGAGSRRAVLLVGRPESFIETSVHERRRPKAGISWRISYSGRF